MIEVTQDDDDTIRAKQSVARGVTAASGVNGSSHVSVKHNMEESLNSRLKDNMWNSSSVLFLSERTLARTIAGSCGIEPRQRNLHSAPPRLPRLRAR